MIKILFVVGIFLGGVAEAKFYNHGYVGNPQFDVNKKEFSLFNYKNECKYRFSDAHFHPRDFTMNGEKLENIRDSADKNCINKILVNSLPLLLNWSDDMEKRPSYYTDDKAKFSWNSISDVPTFEEFRRLPEGKKRNFYFLINGFFHFDRSAKETVESTINLYKDLPIVGFGEIFGDHDIMSDQMNPPSSINTKALDEIYKIAAEKNWFILLHNNIAQRSFKKPIEPNYLAKIENVLQKHPKTTFVWAHAGIMRNIVIDDLPDLIDKVIQRNKNLYIDLSFVVFENYVMAEGKPNSDWVRLIEKHPDRFLFGTDDLAGYKDFADVKKYIPLLDSLKPETARKFASGNLERLIDRAIGNKL